MIDWDAYRAAYDGMSHADQVAFYDRVWELHPIQRHFDAAACARFLDAGHPYGVVEVGGWDGALAAEMLQGRSGIRSWRNIEICTGAAEHPVCLDRRYSVGDVRVGDTLVMSHVIEHMRLSEIEGYLVAVAPRAAFIQSPLTEDGQNWNGYAGSHMLREGWRAVIAMFERHGLKHDPTLDAPDVRCFR